MRSSLLIVGTLGVFLGAALPASASTITFTFDPVSGNPLADGGNSTAIQTHMRKVVFDALGLSNAVTVWGAAAETNNSYDGDDHVVGPPRPTGTNGYTKGLSQTLGNSDNAWSQGPGFFDGIHSRTNDGYIYNSDANKFTMEFTFPIYSVSFDYEIFPNSNCGNPKDAGTPENPGAGGGSCNRWPDFTFKAGNAATDVVTLIFQEVGQDPSEPGYVGFKRSPITGTSINATEKAPQLLQVSGLWTFPQGVTRLEFWDWPERVGIDNLEITTTVPEPTTLLLVGAGAALLGLGRRRTRRGVHAD